MICCTAKQLVVRSVLVVPACIFDLTLPVLFGVAWLQYEELCCLPMMVITVVFLSSTVLSVSGIYAVFHVKNVVDILAFGIILSLLIGTVSMPWLNRHIGYEEACSEAKKMAPQGKAGPIAAWKMKNAEDMDVYLGCVPEVVPQNANPGDYFPNSAVLLELNTINGGFKCVWKTKRARW